MLDVEKRFESLVRGGRMGGRVNVRIIIIRYKLAMPCVSKDGWYNKKGNYLHFIARSLGYI